MAPDAVDAVLTPARLDVLRAVVDAMIPADDLPSGWDSGVGDFIVRILATDLAPERPRVVAALDALGAATGPDGTPFGDLDAAGRVALLRTIEADGTELAGVVHLLADLCAQGYYGDPGNGGNRGEVSWRGVGYRLLPIGRTWPAPEPRSTPTIALDAVRDDYDAIVVGAGAGGGIAAQVLAEAGHRVLLVDRGSDLSSTDLPLDQLRSERSATPYPTRTGPSRTGDPRVVVTDGVAETVHAPDERWGANAFAVGGGTRVYGAQAWRFAPTDFRMRTTYGRPEGSSLADWPLDYDELEEWYDRCEWEFGVSGDPAGVRHAGERRRGYPMPPMPASTTSRVLAAGAARIELGTSSVPLLINSVPFLGRPACVQCGACVGYACHAGAKNGSFDTAVPRALATGLCDLLPDVQVERLRLDDEGVVVGVDLARVTDAGIERRAVSAPTVVVAAGAIETARLLLTSSSEREPDGVGNAHDQVGRNLQAHVYAGAIGFFDDPVQDSTGPGPNIATNDWRHGNPGVVGGGMIADDFVPTPLNAWATLTGLGVIERWGAASKAGMRELWSRMALVFGPVQEVPNPESRVRLEPEVRDRLGNPVARLEGDIHPEDRRTAALLADRAAEWLTASGAVRVIRRDAEDRPAGPSAGQHQAGTCRMGDDPVDSVTDRWGRVWGHPELLLADGSVHVTNGGVNPVLTIMALAYRNTSRLVEDLGAGRALR